MRAGLLAPTAAVAVGGALGAAARYWIVQSWPEDGFPAAVLAVNVSGCWLIGMLMVLVAEYWPERHLVQPFLGTGVLGGFTTFSTYALDIVVLRHSPALAAAYLVATPVLALLATALAVRSTRGALQRWRSG